MRKYILLLILIFIKLNTSNLYSDNLEKSKIIDMYFTKFFDKKIKEIDGENMILIPNKLMYLVHEKVYPHFLEKINMNKDKQNILEGYVFLLIKLDNYYFLNIFDKEEFNTFDSHKHFLYLIDTKNMTVEELIYGKNYKKIK